MEYKKNIDDIKGSYEVPKDYFKKKSDELRALQRIGEVSKETYTLPADYFTKSRARIKQEACPKEEAKVRFLWIRVASAAAVMALLIGFLPLMQDGSVSSSLEFADLSDEDLLSYIDYIDEDVDLNLLLEEDLIDETVLEEVYEESDGSEDYLLDNLDDIGLLELEELL